MSNELMHADPGASLTQAYDNNAPARHYADGQTAGDILYYNGSTGYWERTDYIVIDTANTQVKLNQNLNMNAKNIVLDTTTGTKIGTAASQKLAFFNASPVVQQTKAGHNNWAALSDVVNALVSLGLLDTA